MPTVLLGNTSPIELPQGTTAIVNDEVGERSASIGGKTEVLIVTPDDQPLDKKLVEVRNAFRMHSTDDAVWVEGSDEFFNEAVAQSFGCSIGRPSDWNASESTQEPVSAPEGAVAAPVVADVNVTAEETS